jgi:hypothetical protein
MVPFDARRTQALRAYTQRDSDVASYLSF